MNLTTQCPQCKTAFQAPLEELQLRKGYIRCINCAHIFDGYDAVVSTTDAAVPASAPRPVPTLTPAPNTVLIPIPTSTPSPKPEHPSVPPAAPLGGAVTTASPSVVRHRSDARAATPEPVFHLGKVVVSGDAGPVFELSGNSPIEPETHTAIVHSRSPQRDAPAEPIYLEARNETRRKQNKTPDFAGSRQRRPNRLITALWQLAILIALVLMLGQFAYVYRSQIANKIPALRPVLENACSYLKCTVAYSRRIDLIMISGAALSAKTPKNPAEDSMELLLTLRNDFDKPQEWPTLELDLNDFSGTLQVRKNITPEVYLTAAQKQQPFAAKSETVLRIPLILHGLAINGFQVRKFFP